MPQVAIVVGGTRRVGRWVSEALLVAGYRVHALYRSGTDAARAFAGEMADAGYRLDAHQADALDEAQLGAVIGGIAAAEGLHALVNCWGPSVFGTLSRTSSDELEQMFRGNVLSVHNAVAAALPFLRAAGKEAGESRAGGPPVLQPAVAADPVAEQSEAKKHLHADASLREAQGVQAGPPAPPASGGRIVNFIASAAETGRAFRDIGAYAAAKAMLYSYSRSLARELAPDGVTVNCISLGVAGLMPEGVPPVPADRIPTGRFVGQEDVAAAVWYLVSPPASQVTGTVVNLGGAFGL